MDDRRGVVSPGSLPGPGEVALLAAIYAVLDVPAGELPGRVALVRRYIGARWTRFRAAAARGSR
jgi:hypothetical protein